MNLPDRLFWDIDLATMDEEVHARFIIQRVIQKGELEDWKTIKMHYGLEKIKKEIVQIRDVDNKTLHFFSLVLDIPLTDFRCYVMKQSMPPHFDY